MREVMATRNGLTKRCARSLLPRSRSLTPNKNSKFETLELLALGKACNTKFTQEKAETLLVKMNRNVDVHIDL